EHLIIDEAMHNHFGLLGPVKVRCFYRLGVVPVDSFTIVFCRSGVQVKLGVNVFGRLRQEGVRKRSVDSIEKVMRVEGANAWVGYRSGGSCCRGEKSVMI